MVRPYFLAMFDVTRQVSDMENWVGVGDRERKISTIKCRYFLNCRLVLLQLVYSSVQTFPWVKAVDYFLYHLAFVRRAILTAKRNT